MKKMLFLLAMSCLIGTGYAQVSTFPWTENFDGASFPPADWTTVDESTPIWAKNTSQVHSAPNSASCVITGAGIKNLWLITPQISVPTAGYELQFWSYVASPSSMNYSGVWVSTTDNNSASFTELKQLVKGSADVASPAGWVKIAVDLSAYAGQNIYIGFKYEGSRMTHDWYLDDVSIIDFSTYTDAELTQITSPSAGAQVNLTAAEEVTVSIKNAGGSALSNFDLQLQCGAVDVTETYTGTIAPGDEVEYTFNQKLDLSAAAEYTITTTISGVTDDQVAGNNSKSITLANVICGSTTLFEGFESATFPPACWKTVQVNGTGNWARNTSAAYTHDGTGSAVRKMASGNQLNWLMSAPITVSTAGYALEFYSYTNYSSDIEISEVWVSTTDNNEASFTDKILTIAPNSPEAPEDQWVKLSASLAAYNGQTIYIGFKYGGSYAHDWYIDDVSVLDMSSYVDAELAQIVTPGAGSQTNLTANEAVKVLIKNNGGSALTGFDLQLQCGSVDVTETYSGSIPAGDTASYTFTQKLDLSAETEYTITTTINGVADDQVAGNNSKSITLTNTICGSNTLSEGFESATFPPACWKTVQVSGTRDWERVTSTTHNSSTGCAYHSAVTSESWLISPPITVDAAGYALEFYSYINWPSSLATSEVWVSTTDNNVTSFTDCIKTIVKGTSDAVQAWVKISASLAAYNGQTIYIGFKYGGNNAHGWRIDDVNVLDLSSYVDAELTQITAPVAGDYLNLTTAEEVTVSIKNNGGSALTGFDLKLKCGELEETETYSGSIPAGETASYTFNQKVDLSADGKDTIIVTVIAADDQVAGNDAKQVILTNTVRLPITSFPWVEDFEGETFPPKNWTKSTSISVHWDLNTDADYVYAGTNSAGVSGGTGNQTSWLITPQIAVPATGAYALQFQSYVEYPSGYGNSNGSSSKIWVSTGDNTPTSSFTELKQLQQSSGEVPSPAGWVTITVDLSAYKGQLIYLAFSRNYGNNVSHGWYIDNVSVVDFSSFVDAELVQITNPGAGTQVNLSAAEEVTVSIKNAGGAALSNFGLKLECGEVEVTETYTGTIESGETATYTFAQKLDLSAEGKDTITVTVIAAGDQNAGNDSKTIMLNNVVCTTSIPYAEGFEDNGANFSPCWAQERVTGTTDWKVVTASTGTPNTAPAGDYKAYISGSGGATSKLISPPFDINGLNEPVLTFWHTQADWSGDQDILNVYYRTSSAGAWTLLHVFENNISAWTEDTLVLTNKSSEYQIAFEATLHYGRGIHLDDIAVFDKSPTPPSIDAELARIVTPAQGQQLSFTASEEVKVLVRNNGETSLSDFDLQLQCGDVNVTEDFTDAIPAGDSAYYTFTQKVDLSAIGAHTVTVTVIADNDETPANDSKTVIINQPITTFPYTEDFESETFPPANWKKMSVAYSADWARTTEKTYNSSQGAAWCEYSTEFGTSEAWLITPQFSIPVTEEDFVLEFRSYIGSLGSLEHSGVWVSTTDNTIASFVELKALQASTADIPSPAGWAKITVSLNDYKGQNIYLGFKNRASRYGHDWYIDNFRVSEFEHFVDAEIAQIMEPVAGTYSNLTANETVKVKIKNKGSKPLSSFDLELKVNEAATVTEAYSGNAIPVGDSVEYTLDETIDLSAMNEYTISVTAVATGDIDADNNSKSVTLSNIVCTAVNTFPYIEDFESAVFPPSSPNCWERFQLSGAKGMWERNTEIAHNTGSASFKAEGGMPEVWLVSPKIEVPSTGNYQLSFWSYVEYPSMLQYSGVLVSTDGNDPETADFTEIKKLEASNGDVPRPAAWKKISIPLSDYAGQTINVGFKYFATSVSTHNWYIDDVSVYNLDDYTDVEVAAIKHPLKDTNMDLTEHEQVKVLLRNNGGNSISNIALKLEVDGALEATETYTDAIAAGDSALYTFNKEINLLMPDTYNVKVTAVLTGDQDDFNDSKSVDAKVVSTAVFAPWSEDFEGFNFPPANWTNHQLKGEETSWSKGTLVHEIHGGMFSAFHDWNIEPHESWLVTPGVHIPATGNYVLEFWSHTGLPVVYGYSGIQVSTDGNNPEEVSFTEIKELSGEEISEKWTKIIVPLNDYLGQKIYIGFKYETDNAQGHSWAVDNVKVYDFSGVVDAEIAQLIAPAAGTSHDLTDAEQVKVRLKNNGSDPLSAFDLQLTVNDVIVATENYSGTAIPSLSAVEYTFDKTLDLSALGDYEITVKVIVADDQDASNDAITITVTKDNCLPITEFPFTEGFETLGAAPGCWTAFPNDAVNLEFDGEETHSGSGSAHFATSLEMFDRWLVTPKLSIPDEKEYVLEFWSFTGGLFYEYSGVWVSTGGNNPAGSTFVELKKLNPTMLSWEKISISLKDYAGQDIYIGFKYNGVAAHRWHIDDVSVKEDEGTGILSLVNHEKLSIYPNPVTNELHIQIDKTIKQISVLDMQGRVVLYLEGNNRKVDMSALPKGNYVVRVKTDKGISSAKVVKQ